MDRLGNAIGGADPVTGQLLSPEERIAQGAQGLGAGMLTVAGGWASTRAALSAAEAITSPVAAEASSAVPSMRVSASKYPELSQNILNAQRAGHPSTLTHGGNAAANRAAALEGVPNVRGLSRDEYPFASSREGGAGSWVGHIPASQQQSQGGMLKNFIQKNNIRPGDQYNVVIKP